MKKSKLERKFVNQMRGMSDVPWPARAFTYPATLSVVGSAKETLLGHCKRQVGEVQVRKGKLRRKKSTESIPCGGRVFLRRGSLGKRRVYCESCLARKRQRKLALRMQQQARRFASVSPREQMREERRSTRLLAKFRRSGTR